LGLIGSLLSALRSPIGALRSLVHAVSDPLTRRSTLLAPGHLLLTQLGQLADLLAIDTQGVTQPTLGVLGRANHPHGLVGDATRSTGRSAGRRHAGCHANQSRCPGACESPPRSCRGRHCGTWLPAQRASPAAVRTPPAPAQRGSG